MDRRRLLAASGALAAAALAGCTERVLEPSAETTTTTTDGPDAGDPAATDAALAELVRGNVGFALDLHRTLADAEGGNQFLSPYSVSAALAMVYAGARGETAREIRETLRYTLGQEVHPAFAGLRAALADRETAEVMTSDDPVDAFRLSAANAVWGREGYTFAEEYRSLLERHYGAGLRRAAFTTDPEGARARINDWVAEETEENVEELLPRGSVDPSTVLVLTNAIYFMAGWEFDFDPDETEPGTFTGVDGSESTVPMMRQNLKTGYESFDGGEALELTYVGGQVSMVLLLPDPGTFESFERSLDADTLFEVFDGLSDATGDVRLPRFEYRTAAPLSGPLADLGMPSAFESGANFDGMVPGEDAGLWLDEVYHEAFVSVDEEGTEAAAATAAVVKQSAPAESFDLSFDRPFLFCIRDRPTDAVLFLGRVVDGSAAP